MKNYWVFIEIFGKKMKVKIHASSEAEAREKVKQKIVFHKIAEEEPADFAKEINELINTLGGL